MMIFVKLILCFLFFINLLIALYKFLILKFLTIIPFVIVSGRPPLFDTITAQPRLDASKLVLPKGSSHLEHATAILVFLKIFKTFE